MWKLIVFNQIVLLCYIQELWVLVRIGHIGIRCKFNVMFIWDILWLDLFPWISFFLKGALFVLGQDITYISTNVIKGGVVSWCTPLSTMFSVISEETGENRRPVTSHWQTWPHNVVSSTPRYERDSNSTTLVVIDTD